MIGLIRHSETKVFNKALIQGSLIAYIVFMLFAGAVKQSLVNT